MRRVAVRGARLAAAAVVVPRLLRAGVAARRGAALHAGGDPGGSITVVVPARDEADRIVPLLRSLAGAPHVSEVVVVDDESTDDTVAVALELGARVVYAGERPPGWAGKPWALERGIRTAVTDWVVCLDADVRSAPSAPAALVAHARRERLDLASATTRADLPAAARWLHAAMLTTLVARFGGPGAVIPGRELANGQCLAFRRERLIAAGGFGLVAGQPVEDVAVARVLARAGWTVGLVDSGGLVEVVPARSLGEVWSGWGRSIALPGVERPGRILLDAGALALAMPLPLVRLVTRRADALDVALVAVRLGVLVGMRRAYRSGGPGYWLSPLADPVAIASLVIGATRRTVSWRGRSIRVPAAR